MCTGSVHCGLEPSLFCLAAAGSESQLCTPTAVRGRSWRLPEVRGADIREAPPAETQQRPGLDHAERGSVEVLPVPQRVLVVPALVDAGSESGHERDQEHHDQRDSDQRRDEQSSNRAKEEKGEDDGHRRPQPNPAREAEQTACEAEADDKPAETLDQRRGFSRSYAATAAAVPQKNRAMPLASASRKGPRARPKWISKLGIGDVAREYQGVRSDGFEQRRQPQVSAERRPGRRGRSSGASRWGRRAGRS